MRILIFKKNDSFREILESSLKTNKHNLVVTDDLEVAKNIILQGCLDLAIFDSNAYLKESIKILQFINYRVKNLIKLATISPDIEPKKLSILYNLGCSDHIKSPFLLEEFLIKVKIYEKNLQKKHQKHILLGRSYMFDKHELMLYYGELPVKLTKKQRMIMDVLVSNLGIPVDFEKLRDSVWNGDLIDNATIRAEINRLKKVFDEDIIKNSRGVGYMVERSEFITL
ncbi:MAG: winged helix-turn-helix domain-containing protein [Campylobacterales bacterium]